MPDLWPQENEKEAFQLGLSPVLYCSVTKIVFRCEDLFGDGGGMEEGRRRAWGGNSVPHVNYTATLIA